MRIFDDLKILYHMVIRPIHGQTHTERLESFYCGQAHSYDDFRKRLLKGRKELFDSLPVTPGMTWADMGAGTGSNLEYIKDKIDLFSKIYLVDLSSSLLAKAAERCNAHQWKHIECIQDDATSWKPPSAVDLVTFSYSLTMIPDWFWAIQNAFRILKVGGSLGVVDFYVPRKYPEPGRVRQNIGSRGFWPAWFSWDNVFLSPDHIPYLTGLFPEHHLSEHRSKIPYLPFLRAPYYRFLGMKQSAESFRTPSFEKQ